MSEHWEGSHNCRLESTPKVLELDGTTVTIEKVGVYDGTLKIHYKKITTLHFRTEEDAKYYYKNK